MLERIATALKIPDLASNEEIAQTRRLKILLLFSGLASFSIIFFVPKEVRYDPRLFPWAIVYYLSWTVYCLAGLFILGRLPGWVAALWLTTGIYLYVLSALVLNSSNPYNFLLAYFLIVLLMAALFLGRRVTFFFVLLIGVSTVIVNFINIPNLMMPLFSLENTGLNLVSWVLFFTLFSILLLVFMNSMDERHAQTRRSEEGYRLLFEVSPVALWEHDASAVLADLAQVQAAGVTDVAAYFLAHPEEAAACLGQLRVLNVNETAVSLFNAPDKHTLMHSPHIPLMVATQPSETRRHIAASLAALADGASHFECETACETLSGKMIQVIYRWVATSGQVQPYGRIITSVIDITAQKQAETIHRRYNERLHLIHQIDIAILAAKSTSEIAYASLKLLKSLVPYAEAQVLLFDPEEGEMVSLASSQGFADARFPLTNWEAVQDMFRGSPVQFEDLQAAMELPPLLENLRLPAGRSLFMVPLWEKGELVGGICANFTEPGAFTVEHVEIVQQVAAPLAIAMQNARLIEAERKEHQLAETLRNLANISSAGQDQTQILDAILVQLARVIRFDRAAITLRIEGAYQIVAHRGLEYEHDKLISERIPLLSHMSQVIESCRPHIIADTKTSADWIVLPGGEDIRCWLGVPMLVRGKIVGLLTLDKYEPDFYKESDANLALAFANQAAITIENARLYQQLQQYTDQLERRVVERVRDLNALYNISALSTEPAEMEPVLGSALETVLTALGCFAGAIHLRDDEETFHLLHEIGVPAYVRPFIEHVPFDHEIVGDMLSGNAPTNTVKDIAGTSFGTQFSLQPGELTYAGALMRSKGKLMGVLSAVHNLGRQFTAEDLALLAAIADHVAVTIENGRLHQNARQLAVMQERERMARELHDSVTQSLYSLTLFAEAGRELLEAGKVSRVQVYLNQIVAASLQALREMRLMLYDLRSTTLLEEGLVQALRYRLENVEERAGIETSLTAPENMRLPADVEETLYRISQEALNNTLKHARASRVDITIRVDTSHLTLEVQDNGRGFQAQNWAAQKPGGGLLTMKKQVEQLNGAIVLQSAPDQGTKITVRLSYIPPGGHAMEDNGKSN